MTKKPKPTKDTKQPPPDADKFVWTMGDVHTVPDPRRKAKGDPSPQKEEK